ncbi:Mut7-C RNAse domain protein [Caballeronia sp. SBC1]|uniref:Mut7-C RNAse domain-containing protein n=1 Tax=unclassified Caballeronia TaxID=2646786 RepID=UPI0013E165C4|nr:MULTISPECIES: Mut7-C RNAse domain-containing protein [unclassified Caballeronia]QIE25271.1 Mut7-C RNAse domain protein [Caballeronia sp. SBC2]QIN63317.1 Mut7-C RNAse domain protein [Caballeronia sp. SBC1]
MTTATFRFHRELNEFLARPQREQAFACVCPVASTTKHMIEALGVPHTEVALILRNGLPTGFDTLMEDADFIDVYPPGVMPRALEIVHPLRAPLRLETLRFIADAHLGGLAQLLRLAGFDTYYDNHFPDDEIEQLALAEHRVVLTRDRELLKRRSLVHGCYVRTLQPDAQWREVATRLGLAQHVRPFRLCLMCNAPLRRASADEVSDRVPEGVLERHARFVTCDVCRRVFWEGSHWKRMRARIEELMDAAPGNPPVPASG